MTLAAECAPVDHTCPAGEGPSKYWGQNVERLGQRSVVDPDTAEAMLRPDLGHG